jgi:cellulose synthase/poly-beta-1,6-N-acetylglucosamine synthase-like glycosyltransferase
MVENINDQFLPEISVIIPIYNGEQDLPDLINCLYQQTYPQKKVEYLLVNNNSQDNTENILKTLTEKAKLDKFPLFYLNENEIQSSYAARNKGIKASKSDILVFTDADCRPNSDWLTNLIKPFKNPEIGIVVGEIIALEGDSFLEKYAESKHILSQKYTLENLFCSYGQTANLAIRKDCFREIGLFRPYLTTGGDADICWRILRETNWQIKFAETAIIKHRHRQNITELKKQWRRYGTSYKYLHELYNTSLNRDLTTQETLYRLTRWLLKEIPVSTLKIILDKGDIVDIIKTPLDLICFREMTKGKNESKLPEKARQIEYLIDN